MIVYQNLHQALTNISNSLSNRKDWDLVANRLGFLANDIQKIRANNPGDTYEQATLIVSILLEYFIMMQVREMLCVWMNANAVLQ